MRVISEHPHQVRYELLRVGRRLDELWTGELTWPDLAAVIACCPPGSPLRHELTPESQYSTTDQLLLGLINLTRTQVWLLNGAPESGRPRDVLLPGMRSDDQQQFGSDAIPIADFDAWWDAN